MAEKSFYNSNLLYYLSMFFNLKYFMFGVRYYHVAYGNESFTMQLVANYMHFLGVTSGGLDISLHSLHIFLLNFWVYVFCFKEQI